MEHLGEVNYYVHEKFGVPLIVTDDDISGTFTFVRALSDYGNREDLSAAQIGESWLNYLIEERTILWWGGLGNSTEHTAYMRLKHGISAPRSGCSSSTKRPRPRSPAGVSRDSGALRRPWRPATTRTT